MNKHVGPIKQIMQDNKRVKKTLEEGKQIFVLKIKKIILVETHFANN